MRARAATTAAVGVAAALAATAALAGLGGGTPAGSSTTPPAAAGPPPLPPGALPGTLWYADEACRVVPLDLPTLARQPITGPGLCRIWPSPDGRFAAVHPGRPFTAPAGMALVERATGAVTRPFGRPDLAGAPPAWSPAGDLVVCDARRAGERLVAMTPPRGRPRTVLRDACYPGFAGGRPVALATRGRAVVVAGRRVADEVSLGRLLGERVTVTPGPAAAGTTVAVPATRGETTFGPPPETVVVVLLDAGGRRRGLWHTGLVASELAVLGGGRFVAATGRTSVVVRDIRRETVYAEAGGGPVRAAAASPGGRWLALAGDRSVVVVDARSGRPRWRLDVRARWLGWSPTP